MPHYNLALLGFGNVGCALGRLLLHKQAELKNNYDITFSVTEIATGHHGIAVDPLGVDLREALALVEAGERLTSLNKQNPSNAFDFIRRSRADVLFENIPVSYKDGQPAVDYLRLALEMGMHAITANKGPVVHAYRELSDLATANGCKFYFESAVMGGTPIFSLFRGALPAADLISFRGVLNSTTNVILTQMEHGESFDQGVAYAQSIGVAETDPSGDIDGWDAAVKVAALVTVLMGVPLKPQEVDRTGIRGVTSEEIARAQTSGERWKLICSARRKEDRIVARVVPEMVAPDSPFYRVNGTTSIVQFETEVLGPLSIFEENPGPDSTAYGLLADFLNAVR